MVKCNSEPYSTPYKESGCVNDQKRGKRKNWSGGKHKHSEPNKLTNQSAKRWGGEVVPKTLANLSIKKS